MPAGDMVKISCRSKTDVHQRLVINTTHHVKGSNCFGNFLDLVCFKISNQVAEWRVLSDPHNSKLPECVDECKENRFIIYLTYQCY